MTRWPSSAANALAAVTISATEVSATLLPTAALRWSWMATVLAHTAPSASRSSFSSAKRSAYWPAWISGTPEVVV